MKNIGLRAALGCVVIGFLIAVMGFGSIIRAATIEELRAAELQKVEAETELGSLWLLSAGGPDTFGYSWIDSDEPGGPTFDWVDISSVGTPVPFASYVDDGNVGPIPIGFDFPFYGNTFNELYVCSNGWLSFTNSTLQTYTNQPLPNSGSSVPENLLAVWWDDMVYDESDGNEAFYYNDGSRFIIEFYIRRIAAFTPPFYRFQVILYPNGNIVYQYHTLGVTLNSSTIGIQNGDKDDGLTVVYNDSSYAHENLAILFTPRSVVSIDIKPGSCPNPLNTKSKGVLPVAILGTQNIDVTQIDVSTVMLEGVAPIRDNLEDVATPFNGASNDDCLDCTTDGPDGLTDLILHFDMQEVVAALGEVSKGQCLTLTITGNLLDGTPFEGSDLVVIR